MRLSVNLKEEYYEAVRAHSKAENVSLSQALNRLLATAFQRSCPPTNEGGSAETHFPTSRGAQIVTSALVDAIETDAWLAELARRKSGLLATLDSGLALLHPDIAAWVPES